MSAIHLMSDEPALHRIKLQFEVSQKQNNVAESPTFSCFQVENKMFATTAVDVEFFSDQVRNEFAKSNSKFQAKLKRLDSLTSGERNAFCDAVIEIFEELKESASEG